MRKPSRLPTSSDTNQAVQPQKMDRGLKFWIKEVAIVLRYLCSKNKGADKLCGYHTADLRFCFCKFSHDAAHKCFRAREGSQYPPDATIDARQFVIRDFVVSSSIAVFGNVTADGTKVEVSSLCLSFRYSVFIDTMKKKLY